MIWRLQLVPVWYESAPQPHSPHSMHGTYLEAARCRGHLLISHLGDGYGLAAGKPMLVGHLTRPAPDLELELTAMIVGIRSAGAVSYRHFAALQELNDFSRRLRCLAE